MYYIVKPSLFYFTNKVCLNQNQIYSLNLSQDHKNAKHKPLSTDQDLAMNKPFSVFHVSQGVDNAREYDINESSDMWGPTGEIIYPVVSELS